MEPHLKREVVEVITTAMDGVMDKVLHQDPFDMAQRQQESPLHAALMPEDIFKGSHFERRFVTPFGKVWEKLAEAVGRSSFGFGAREHMVVGRVRQQSLDRIRETLDRLEHKRPDGNRVQPNWDAELKYVRAGGGPWQDVSVNCDVYVGRAAGEQGLAFELKAAKPNSDQTKVSKEKLLKLHCMKPRQVKGAYYALPYNPYGSRERYDWWAAQRWFNMREDRCVLIGHELWDKLGGKGTYQSIIEVAESVGKRYKRRIYEEYLGRPPSSRPG